MIFNGTFIQPPLVKTSQVKTLVKYKCIKTQCPICGNTGSLQLFINKSNKVTYARVRHYKGKGKFTYCKIEDLEALKTLLNGQYGQGKTVKNIDHKQNNSSLKIEMAGPVGFEPTTFSLEGLPNIDLKAYREYLDEKYSRQYACLMFGYIRKHYQCFLNPNELLKIPASIRSNVLKAMVCFSKYASCYEDYKSKLKNSGIKWVTNDSAFTSFLRIVNNNHSDLGQWYSEMQNVLRENEKLFLRFVLVTGLRKSEAVKSVTLVIKLQEEGKLDSYFKDGILEHFRFPELFFRKTKMAYISIAPEDLASKITQSKPVSYFAMRKRIVTHKQRVRIKELRSYFATYLRQHGILAEYIDLLQGRIPKNVFARHYLKVEDVKELVKKVLDVTATIESNLLS
jgi:intergrase/recombinase